MGLYIDERGDPNAPTILFLHAGGLSSRQWTPQMDALTEFHRLAPDLPEQGRSKDVGPLTLEHTLPMLADLIRSRAPSGRVHGVGLSLGGTLALALLDREPELFESMIVSGSASSLSPTLAKVANASNRLMFRLMPPQRMAWLTVKSQRVLPQYQAMLTEDLTRSASLEFNERTLRVLMDAKRPARAERLLVVAGQKETVAAKSAARTARREIVGATGVIVPGARHLWNLQYPDLFTDMIRAWVTGAPLPRELRTED